MAADLPVPMQEHPVGSDSRLNGHSLSPGHVPGHSRDVDTGNSLIVDDQLPLPTSGNDKDSEMIDHGNANPDNVPRASDNDHEMADVGAVAKHVDQVNLAPEQQLMSIDPREIVDGNVNLDLDDAALHYLQLYVNCKGIITMRDIEIADLEAANAKALEDLTAHQTALKHGQEYIRRTEKCLARAKEEVNHLKLQCNHKDAHIANMDRSLDDTQAILNAERAADTEAKFSQHTRNLQAQVDGLMKLRNNDAKTLRAEIQTTKRTLSNANLALGQQTASHTVRVAQLEQEIESLKEEYDSEKQQRIDMYDAKVGGLEVKLEKAELDRDLAIQERHVAIQARDDASTARDEAVSSKIEAITKYEEVLMALEEANSTIAELRQQMGGAQLGPTVENSGNNSVARFQVAPAVPDEFVLGLWKDLRTNITFLVEELTGIPKATDLSPEVIRALEAIAGPSGISWEHYMANEKHRKLLVEALIWELINNYFEHNCIWLGEPGTRLRELLSVMKAGLMENATADDLRQYSIIRAESANVIHKITDSRHDISAFQMTVAVHMEHLRPFYSPEAGKLQNKESISGIQSSIYDIIHLLFRLDNVFMGALPQWKVVFRRDLGFWAPSMHEVPTYWGNMTKPVGETFPIAFQIAPCLRKNGNDQGEDYGSAVAISKGTVMPFVQL